MQAAKLERFMKERKHDSLSDGFVALVAEMMRRRSTVREGFNTEEHKQNYLREAEIDHQ